MQSRYCYPNASLYAPEADEARLNIKKLTGKAREYDMPLIYTWMTQAIFHGKTKLVEALKPESQDYIIEKSHYSMLL